MTNADDDHLRLLSIFHYVVGCIAGLFGLLPVIHLLIGLTIVASPEMGAGDPAAPLLGWMFVGMACVGIAVGLTFAGFVLYTGRCLARRERHLFCTVMGGIECMFMPFGTVLGVFTILVLCRPSVKELFDTGI